MKKHFYSLASTLLILTLLIGCQQEDSLVEPKADPNALTVKQAQAWFDSGQSFQKASPANKKKKQFPPVSPQWEKAREGSDKTYYIVEAPVKMATKLAFKLQGTDTAPNGITKLLILKNKATGRQISALMHAFSLKGMELAEINYRNLPKDFDGMVFYTSLQGALVNGYTYKKGKIISSFKASEQTSGSRTYCNSYGHVEIWERTCTVNPDGPDYCSAPYFVGFEPVPICNTVYDELSAEGPAAGSSGGGSSDDGGYIELIDVYELPGDLDDITNTISLTSEERAKLEAILATLKENCLGEYILTNLKNNSIKFNFSVNSNMSAQGSFNPSSFDIQFKNLDAINLHVVREELFHAFQNKFYSGGILQYYGKENSANIEFEAKLLANINSYINTQGTAFAVTSNDYIYWIDEITNGGQNYPSNFSGISSHYNYYLGRFIQDNPAYSNTIAGNLAPNAMFQIFNNANC